MIKIPQWLGAQGPKQAQLFDWIPSAGFKAGYGEPMVYEYDEQKEQSLLVQGIQLEQVAVVSPVLTHELTPRKAFRCSDALAHGQKMRERGLGRCRRYVAKTSYLLSIGSQQQFGANRARSRLCSPMQRLATSPLERLSAAAF